MYSFFVEYLEIELLNNFENLRIVISFPNWFKALSDNKQNVKELYYKTENDNGHVVIHRYHRWRPGKVMNGYK